MPYFAWPSLGAVSGLAARRPLMGRFPILFRLQQALLASPMAIVAGWSVVVETRFATTLAVVALVEWVTLAAVRAGRGDAILASAAHANAGFWPMPVTSAWPRLRCH